MPNLYFVVLIAVLDKAFKAKRIAFILGYLPAGHEKPLPTGLPVILGQRTKRGLLVITHNSGGAPLNQFVRRRYGYGGRSTRGRFKFRNLHAL